MVKRVPCEHCGNMVAETSRLCPYCRSKSPNRWRSLGSMLMFIILVGIMAVAMYQKQHR